MSDLPNDVDAELRRMGYDPEELGKYGARLAKLLIDNAALRAEVEALKKSLRDTQYVAGLSDHELREVLRVMRSFILDVSTAGYGGGVHTLDRLMREAKDLLAVYKDVNSPAPAPQKPEGLCRKCNGSHMMPHPSGARAAGETQCDRCNGTGMEPASPKQEDR